MILIEHQLSYLIAFVLGTCITIDREKQKILLSFPLFHQECSKDFKYLNKYCSLSLPEGSFARFVLLHILIPTYLGGYEITEEIYDELEDVPRSKPVAAVLPLFAAGDAIFISANAWKNSFYKNDWPYAVEISKAYFEARVERITKNGTKFQISFTAFDVEFSKSEYQRYTCSRMFARQT